MEQMLLQRGRTRESAEIPKSLDVSKAIDSLQRGRTRESAEMPKMAETQSGCRS